MEPIIILALITGVSSLVMSILTHIRTSQCYQCRLQTYTPQFKDFPILTEKTPLQ